MFLVPDTVAFLHFILSSRNSFVGRVHVSTGDQPPPDYEIARDESSLQSRIDKLLTDKQEELRSDAGGWLQRLHPKSIVPGDEELRDVIPVDRMIREVLLSSRLPMPFLRRSRVGPSLIAGAGRGLFATVDIPNGEVITCYPGDALLYEMDDTTDMVLWGAHVPETHRLDDDAVFDGTESKPPLTSYAVAVDEEYSVMGHPAVDDDPAYYGHYANDGAGHLAMEKSTSERDVFAVLASGLATDPGAMGPEKTIANYVMQSLEMANAMHHAEELNRLHVVTVATRDIRAGEEILVAYGPDYWMGYS